LLPGKNTAITEHYYRMTYGWNVERDMVQQWPHMVLSTL
jgi:hypothetical protein